MFIQNVSYEAIQSGNHMDLGERCMLIQIIDPYYSFPCPRYKEQFVEIYQFHFHDTIRENDGVMISDAQVKEIVRLLQHALDSKMNTIVHCAAGISRSGAVAEIGVMMGFEDTGAHRIPNVAIKSKMMKVLGWTYD